MNDYGLRSKIKNKFPIEFNVEGKETYLIFTFPSKPDSDYRFILYLYEEGNLSIGAELINNSSNYYFWSRLIEQYSKRTVEEMQSEAIDVLGKILRYDTKIVQKKGWLFWHFSCQYEVNGHFESVGGNSTLKFPSVKVPNPGLSKKVYHSKALL